MVCSDTTHTVVCSDTAHTVVCSDTTHTVVCSDRNSFCYVTLGAWPVLIDDFVDYARPIIQAKREDMV